MSSSRFVRQVKILPALLFPVILLLLSATASAQTKVDYEISFPNAVHHEAEISVTFKGAPVGKPLEARMSRSSPGRYALAEFAKNVYNVKAFDASGAPLSVTHPNPYQWDVTAHKGTVKITYTHFADYASGTYSGIDNTHAHLNMPATFMWARGFDKAPVQIVFKPFAPDWKVATQLVETNDPYTFTAPNFQYFMDSITEVSNFRLREWKLDWRGKTYNYRLAIHDIASDKEVDDFVEMLKKVVTEEVAVFGEPAPYDYGTYTFIACYMPYVFGDGMEHRNSTSLTSSIGISAESGNGRRGGARGNLSTAAHEFFHSWNVKRLRPLALEPFDYERANMSGELWLAEGFTQYYGLLSLRRAGFMNDDQFLNTIGGSISNVLNSPGRQFFSPVGMSQESVFFDGGISIDTTNRPNINISYYTWGSIIAASLDLTLRTKYRNLTLDDYMRTLWQMYGKVMKPYTVNDLEVGLAKVTGDQKFAHEFFQHFIEGKEVPDFAPLLAQAGYEIRKARPGKVWLDSGFRVQDSNVVVASPTLIGGPLYKAGLDRFDIITSLDGQTFNDAEKVESYIESHKPGDRINVEYIQRGEHKKTTIVLTEDPQLEVVSHESTNKAVTDAIKKFREQWLGSHAAVSQ